MKNRTMMQMFEWYLPKYGVESKSHWAKIAEQAPQLAADGINMVWLPPAFKGLGGTENVGYSVYDVYDLGEFDQKGSIPTKYGTKADYLNAVEACHANGMEVLCDIVMNHRMGADETEWISASKVAANDRKRVEEHRHIKAWTKFTFPGRKGTYSDFTWSASNFTGVDYDGAANENGVFLFDGKSWGDNVDEENGNYDYLMGVDIDLHDEATRQELLHFGKWYYDTVKMDGFRLDAVKHMSAEFYRDWIREMRAYSGKELFTVGEYWSYDLSRLQSYIHHTEGAFSLFDVPLHMRFYEISYSNGQFDMSRLFENTLTGADSWHAVTFVDNHDTQPGQALSSYVNDWFKEIAYAIILLQEKGIPCVFYGDYYGIEHEGIYDNGYHNTAPVYHLKTLLRLRSTHAYGRERHYYDHPNLVGFTREGDQPENGLALLCTNGDGGSKWMEVGRLHAGQRYVDALGHRQEIVTINSDGWGEFFVNGGSVSVWVPEKPEEKKRPSLLQLLIQWVVKNLLRKLASFR